MKRPAYIISLAIASGVLLRCGSLVNEVDRIRAQYNEQNGPLVVATDPADSSIGPYNQTYIEVTFSSPLDAQTITAQANFGACSGSFQVSYDGFTNCLGGSIDASANPRIRFNPVIFPKGLGLQIRTSSAIIGSNEAPAKPYTSPVGFKLGAPCGAQNCFFSYSTPLITNAGSASGVFLVRAGPHAGKYLVYTWGQTSTTLIDPVAVTSQAGPSFAGSCDGAPDHTPNQATFDFLNFAGTKQIILRGAGGTNACVYDHAANTFSKIVMGSLSGLGGHAFVPQTGTEADHTLLVSAHNNMWTHKYSKTDVTSGTAYTTGVGVNLGAHSIRVNTLTYANSFLLFTNAANVQVFSESAPGWSPGYTIPIDGTNGVGAGASSFEVTSGVRQNQVITVRGNNRASLYAYDVSAGTVPTQPANLAANVNDGGRLLRQTGTATETAPVVLHGSGSAHATSIYNSGTGEFEVGPVTTGAILAGSTHVFIPGIQGGGAFFIVNGNATPSTSVYFPATKSFSGTRMPLSVPNAGAHAFRISGGEHDGKTMIVAAGATRHTAIYDPLRHTMTAGKDLVNSATATSLSVPLTQGSYAGNVLTFLGGGSFVFNVYNAATDQYLSSGAAGLPTSGAVAAINTGATAFTISGSLQILIVRGNGTGTHIFDQSGGGISAGPVTSCTVNSTPANVQFRTTAGVVKQAVFCQTNQVTIFDHTGLSFSTTTLSGPGGAGLQMYTIPSGTEAGNVLVIHGGGTATTSIINRDTLMASPGPSVAGVAACGNTVVVDAGAQLLPIPYGQNAGKAALIVGGSPGGSPVYCLYDPATNSFGSASVVNANGSPGFAISNGSVAFRTYGGLYPTGFVVLSGANKNVWSTYVP
ncbi:MAG: hypothetical protein U1F16_04125 [Turneriella sp.]